MKKNLLLTFLAFACLDLFGQITITSSNLFEVGDVFITANDTLPNPAIQPGLNGNQTWDFSMLQNHYLDTTTVIAAAGTLFADDFPQANLAIEVDSSSYGYFRKDNNELVSLGIGLLLPISDSNNVVTNYELFLREEIPVRLIGTPLNYSDTYSQSTHTVNALPDIFGFGADSIKLESFGALQQEVDAFGTLTMPGGAEHEVLRIKEVSIDTNYTSVLFFGFWATIDTTYSPEQVNYQWITNQGGIKYPLVTFGHDEMNNEVESVNWLVTGLSDTDEPDANILLEVFPNPTADFLNVSLEDFNEIGTLEIISFNGTMVFQEPFNGTEQIEVKNWQSGFYVCVFKNSLGQITSFKKFEVMK